MTSKQIASLILAALGTMVWAYTALIGFDVFMAWWTFNKMSTMLTLHGMNADAAAIGGIGFMLFTMAITNGVALALIRRKKTIWAPSIGVVMIVWFGASYIVGAQYSGSAFDIMSGQPRMKYYRTQDNMIHDLPLGAESGPEGQPAYLFDPKTAEEYAKQQKAAKKTSENVNIAEPPRQNPIQELSGWFSKPKENGPPPRPLITFIENEWGNSVDGWVEELQFRPDKTVLFLAARGTNHQKGTIALDEGSYLVNEGGIVLTSTPGRAEVFKLHHGFGGDYYGYDIRADEVFHFMLQFQSIWFEPKELLLHYKWFGENPIALGPLLPFAKKITAEASPPLTPKGPQTMSDPIPKPPPSSLQSSIVNADPAATAAPNDSPPETADHPILVNPVKTFDVRPVYPKSAEAANIDGTVIVEAEIDTDGNVVNPRIVQSIPMLDQAAIDAVSQWKYRPGLRNGNPVSVKVTVRVKFSQPPTIQNTFPEPDICSLMRCF